MVRLGVGIVALSGVLAVPSHAQCPVTNLEPAQYHFTSAPPPPLDLTLRPVRPECLSGLSRPEHENCTRKEIADYGAAVDAWVTALNAYANDTNRFANEVAVFANSVLGYAEEARSYADAALELRDCEVQVLTGASDR